MTAFSLDEGLKWPGEMGRTGGVNLVTLIGESIASLVQLGSTQGCHSLIGIGAARPEGVISQIHEGHPYHLPIWRIMAA